MGPLKAGTRASSQRDVLNQSGDAAACKRATRKDKEPPEGCSALIRLDLVPLGANAGARARPAIALLPLPPPPARTQLSLPPVTERGSAGLRPARPGEVLARFEAPDASGWVLKQRVGDATRFLCSAPCTASVPRDARLVASVGDREVDAPALLDVSEGATATLLVAPARGSLGGSGFFLGVGVTAFVTGIVLMSTVDARSSRGSFGVSGAYTELGAAVFTAIGLPWFLYSRGARVELDAPRADKAARGLGIRPTESGLGFTF